MKTSQILTMLTLTLGLAQLAHAEHEAMDDQHGHMHGMLDADVNKDGAISREEFSEAHKIRSLKMFDKMDANHDGKLDQAERKASKEKMKDRCTMKDGKMHDHKAHEMENKSVAPK